MKYISFKAKIMFSLVLIIFFTSAVYAEDKGLQSRVSAILDGWTSFRWGQDNLAWVVHYPVQLAEPWVKLETQRRGFSLAEAEAYEESFKKELQFESAEAFLLTVHAFGAPIKLAPVSRSVYLLDAQGAKIVPLRYEKRLDIPMTGLVQGFLFFKKPVKRPFKVVVNGLIPNNPTIFDFPSFEQERAQVPKEMPAPAPTKAPEMSKPKPTPTPRAKPEPAPQKPQQPKPPVVELVLPPKATPAPAPSPKPTEAPKATPTPAPTAAEAPQPTEPAPTQAAQPPAQQAAPMEQVLNDFLNAWIKGDYSSQYNMLSKDSKAKMTKEEFTNRAKTNAFQWALKEGYSVKWEGNRAVVSSTPKLLLIRALYKEAFSLTKEEEHYRVNW